jgi:CRP-like cAMP-binding protein
MLHRSRSGFPLSELAMFFDITRREAARASTLLTPVKVAAGQQLMQEGSTGREFLVVADGLVEVTREDELLAVVTAGEVLGEMSLLYRVPRSATATTIVPTTVYAATPREFFTLLEVVPSAAQRIVDGAAARLRSNKAA